MVYALYLVRGLRQGLPAGEQDFMRPPFRIDAQETQS